MLTKLTIKNVALIDNAQLDFTSGLNVLSGETGSGKSVILDSVNFVLGAKADKSMIRYGENECFVKAEFEVEEGCPVLNELERLDIEPETSIIISRRYSSDSRGSIKINGNTVNASMLKRVTSCLVDVHGQSEHFYLLKESNQLKVLDNLAGDKLEREKEKLSLKLEKFRDIKKQLSLLGTDVSERYKKIDILKFQIDEISSAALKDGEEEVLKDKRDKINNLEKIAEGIKEAVVCLSGDGYGLDCLKNARKSINFISRYSKEYEELASRLEDVVTEAEDISETLTDIQDNLFFDEREAAEVEERLDLIKSLKKKYGASVNEINAYLENAEKEYDMLVNCDEQYEKLQREREKLLSEIYGICLEITAERKNTAEAFSSRVVNELKTLNIPKASFKVEFSPYEKESAANASIDGLDDICFMFSANAGEPLKPLGKIISGGEMSRFMLSIKTQLSGINGISTYIFDEIDTGISGKTAKVTAEKIASISRKTQVIAVSHLPQMAAMSDNEMLIEKREEGGKTLTKVTNLDRDGKIKEIVRLLGGEPESEFVVKHAEEMYENSIRYKNSL